MKLSIQVPPRGPDGGTATTIVSRARVIPTYAKRAFVILGDFNRRLAVPGDWAWRLLSPPSARLHLATSGLVTRCDPRFAELIDHLVAGGGAEAMLVSGSTRELPRHGSHPDHCAVSASFRIGGTD